jgi:hypothetical protein
MQDADDPQEVACERKEFREKEGKVAQRIR